MKAKEKPCPKCGSLDVVPIAYGYPGPEMMDAAEKGLIELGGCCVTDDDPRKQCRACGEQFDRPPVRGAGRATRRQPPRRKRRL
jgi:hypothetical protein